MRNPILNILCLFALILLIVSCKRKEGIHPAEETISESVYASGIVKSKNQYQVYATVSGLIEDVLVKEGEVIKKGDPIFRVLNEPSKLNAANATLAAGYADLAANAYKLKEAQEAIALALGKLKNDSLLLVRQTNLKSHGIGTQVEFEQRELAYRNSAADYEVALIRYRDLKRQLEFASTQSKINQKISASLAGDYVIKSEEDGMVYKLLKEKGELINTLNPVAIMGDTGEFVIEMKVDEYDISRIEAGQKVLVTLDSYKGSIFEARVVTLGPLMDEQSRSFIVTAAFIKKPKKLYPNLSIEANIIIRSTYRALTIPRSYLIADSLVLLDKNKTRKVTVGLMDYQKAEILNGLSLTDVIYKPDP